MRDWDKVERYNFNAGVGCSPHSEGVIVKSEVFDALLAEHKIIRRALENASCEAGSCASQHFSQPETSVEEWLSEARKELETPQNNP